MTYDDLMEIYISLEESKCKDLPVLVTLSSGHQITGVMKKPGTFFTRFVFDTTHERVQYSFVANDQIVAITTAAVPRS